MQDEQQGTTGPPETKRESLVSILSGLSEALRQDDKRMKLDKAMVGLAYASLAETATQLGEVAADGEPNMEFAAAIQHLWISLRHLAIVYRSMPEPEPAPAGEGGKKP